jgi:hypothetical protein
MSIPSESRGGLQARPEGRNQHAIHQVILQVTAMHNAGQSTAGAQGRRMVVGVLKSARPVCNGQFAVCLENGVPPSRRDGAALV